ncbi:MAG: FliM/FliN family flagellar motor switch protein [Paenirhodobacter sp.]|uniref:FliM/FliN family flagellar motor switch protein n=1 Tax=Paenirhodobacter sp. TaxID=1965326 RepID=UPI003D0997F9
MGSERGQTILRRKAEAGKPAPDSAPMTPERALSQALTKSAQDLFELPLQVASLRESRMTLADLPEALEDLSLIALIEGPGENFGFVALPPVTLATLIEMQTMGRLAKGLQAPRKPTRVDAAMAADFIDEVLETVEQALAETDAVVWAGGFRYSSYLDDPRPLGLILEDVTYRVWKAELELGAGGERQGNLLWVVPVMGRGQRLRRQPGAALPEARPPEVVAQEQDWAGKMESTVMGTQAVLEAVLHRVTLPLSAVMQFSEGTQIPLPADALERIVLEGAAHRRLSLARLGQHRGQRALRLIGEEAEEICEAPPAPKKVVPPPFEVGESPYSVKRGASAPHSPAAPEADFPAMGLGSLDMEGDLPPLDGFGAAEEEDLPPLKLGSGL